MLMIKVMMKWNKNKYHKTKTEIYRKILKNIRIVTNIKAIKNTKIM